MDPTPREFAMLTGRTLAGAGSDWLAIGSPVSHPVNVATTIVPPVQTNNISYTVAFFAFASLTDAGAFYANPPLDSRLIVDGIQAYNPLAGATGIPAPSRGLDLRQCLWRGGPGQGGSGGGTPSGGTLDASGNCSVGTSSSFGVATLIQRNSVVVMVESFNNTVIGGAGNPADLAAGTVYGLSALALLQDVGL